MTRHGFILAIVCLFFSSGCHDHDDDGHDEHGHDHGDEEGHDHSEDHPEGHDHHEEGHGHHDGPVVSFTLWSDRFELFGEYPPGVVGVETEFLIHVTTLDDFHALSEGTLTLELDGPTQLRGESSTPVRDGIFQVGVTPTAPGTYRGRLVITGPAEGVVEGIELTVFADAEGAEASVEEGDDEGVIEFLKEQQWGVPFGTVFVESGTVVSSVEVSGRINTPPGGTAEVGASIAGRLVAPRDGFPRPGATVQRGQVLATLVPAPSSPEGAARASLAMAEAQARAGAAQTSLERAERLIRDEAISQRELEDARREAQVAQESVRAAQRAAALFSGAGGGGGRGSWRLTSPIDGTLVSVSATAGGTVSPGDALFRIVDTSELWIVARVPEQDAARLRTDRDASFRVAGLEQWRALDITGEDQTATLVTVGRAVDPRSRTVDVIYSLTEPDDALRVDGLVQVSLPAGEESSGLVVPRNALIDQEGRNVVYVQVDGEHFEERLVRIGPRAGDRVAVRGGLQEGERIVTVGAHLVRLADRASGAEAHGHIH